MSDMIDGNEGEGAGKHEGARAMAEAAARAQQHGDTQAAGDLLAQATRADPQAVETLLMDLPEDQPTPGEDDTAGSDREVELIGRTIQPHADAPSRAGITGAGSGADDM